ncbi:hypothetical protein ACFL7M_04770 [Thermodesulfobacteriota bacterium]
MKKLLVTILLLLAATSYASHKAITDTGKEVILHSDGTWEYSDKEQKATKIIKTNKRKFERPRDSSFLIKSKKNNSAFWINTDKWSFNKAKFNVEAEYEFVLKGKDLYAMVVTEGIEIPPETLTEMALENAQVVAPDAKIVKREYRVVNGKKVIYMETMGTMRGINIVYSGYYYSDASGSTQFLTYTTTKLRDRYESEITDFLNGLDQQ